MAEDIKNIDLSKYNQFIVNENNNEDTEIKESPTQKETSTLDKYKQYIIPEETTDIVVQDKQPSTLDKYKNFIVGEIPQIKTDKDISDTGPITAEEPSWFRKFLYGFDKQDQFFGNVFRIGKAKFQDIRDDSRDLKDVLQDNAGIENQKLLNKFKRFRGQKYDDDIYVKAGEMASMLLDPFYLMAYLTPWGRAATTSYKGLALIGGTTVGLDKLISDYAKTGEFKPGDAAIAAGSGAVLGPAAMKAFKVIGKYFPGADKKKIAQVIQAAEGAKAKKLGLSNKEFKKINEIVADKEFITVNNLIKKTGENYSKPFKQLTFTFDKRYDSLTNTIKSLKDLNKKTFTKKTENQINSLTSKKDELLKQFKKDRKELVKKQSSLLQKENDLIAKRDIKILEKLRQNESLTDAGIRYVLSASTRPLFGAGVGYAFGTLWGAEDDDINKWIIGGATLGALQKGIKASKVLTVGDKNLSTNLLNNEAVKLTLQKLRELTATTTATKLEAFGGKTEQLGRILLQNIDSPYAKNSVSKVADEIQRTWTTRAVNIAKPFTKQEQANALNSLRGSKITLSANEKKLKGNIQTYLDDFKKLYNDAGIFSKENIKDYFPRVYNFDRIQRNPKAFEEALVKIFQNKKVKNPLKEARKFQEKINDISNFNIIRTNIDDLINDKKLSDNYIVTPLSNHINKQRELTGSFTQVEKILSDGGFLVNDTAQVLSSLVNRSANSIAFAQRFGPNGEFLTPFFQAIKNKYKDTGKANWRELAKKETQLVSNTIEAYFDRFGVVRRNQLKGTAGILSTISNLNMLDRVTIASLGDLVQPFTNSTNWSTWLRALSQTSLTARGETGLAKNLGQAQSNEIRAALQKPLAIKGDEISANASWLGEGGALTKTNNLFFKLSGLEWITGFARRFAYNAGATDAFITSRKLANFVSKGGKLNSNKAAGFIKDLERYGITAQDALRIGSNKSFDAAAKTSVGKKNLNDAGILAANRDAIIPQVSNRLLFTQSNTPWVRLLGQFLSWAMAKSAQTNKILSRIENGDARTMVKLLAALPVYGGIQELREMAKYGEVVTDIGADTDEWWAESIRLSGLPGVLPEFLASNLVGPGSRQPFFLAFPAGSIAFESDKILRDYLKGNTERASERFFQRIAPLPNWRNFILERAKDLGVEFDDEGRKLPETKLERRQFNTGDLVTKYKRLGNLSSRILEQGVTADLLKQSIFNDKQKFNIGGAVAKAITKGITKATGKSTSKNLTKNISNEINKNISKELDFEINPGKTAISTTTGTYKKMNKILDDNNVKTVHDFGSGLGLGSKEFVNKKVTSHEPFVAIEKIIQSKGKLPDYKSADDVILKEGFSSKQGVVNANVLNVISDPVERANVVKQIGQLVSDDGVAIITTRGNREILSQAKKSKNAEAFADGFIFGSGDNKTFQKGFSQKELEKYVQDILGDLFKVEKIPNKYGIGTSGVIIKKVRPTFKDGDEVIVPPKKPEQFQSYEAMLEGNPGAKESGIAITVIKEKPLLPKKKPNIKILKDYSKVSELEKPKKEWLFNTAEKVYKTNTDNIIPSDIILAINSEETGWGTSRFIKDGSKNLFNIQVFDKNKPHIKATDSKAMIKKYATEEDSIKDFLNLVNKSEKYSNVRETIAKYNQGVASKEDIIDSIAATGYAENNDWSSNVKSILNRRISGKNKQELANLYVNLFTEE